MEYTVGPRLLIAELQRRLLGHDSGTGNPPWHHDRSLAVSVVQDHSVTHRRSRSLLRLTGGVPRLMPGLPPQSPCEEGVDDCDEDVDHGGDGDHCAIVLIEPREDLMPHATAPSPRVQRPPHGLLHRSPRRGPPGEDLADPRLHEMTPMDEGRAPPLVRTFGAPAP